MEISRLLLDTSAYSSFMRGSEDIKQALQGAHELYISPVVIGELLAGFAMGKKQRQNREILAEFLSSPRVKILPIDRETSERYAALYQYLRSQGTPIPTNDLWIAAGAMQYGLMLITTDRHFDVIPHVLKEIYG
jgi:tRNA(fMet)-specific endonuclease VapC